MASLTTNPSPYTINIPELQNVATSASGVTDMAALTTSVNSVLEYIDVATGTVRANGIAAYTSGAAVEVTSPLNLSNGATITMNSIPSLTDNTVGGNSYLGFTVNGSEYARLQNGGDLRLNGTLHISTATATNVSVYASGAMYATQFLTPSDPVRKRDIVPYSAKELPNVYEFKWKSTGARDIGVLASEVAAIEPVCVQTGPDGTQYVDYAKLVVLCLSEIKKLREILLASQQK